MPDFGDGPLPLSRAERLWRNHKRYCGETVDIRKVIEDSLEAAQRHGWTVEPMLPSATGGLPALKRMARDSGGPGNAQPKRLYISAGIHGDEPASPLAALELLQRNAWPETLELLLCPCLNPDGFDLNTRENAAGIDLNRQYRHPNAPAEIAAHIAWLKRQTPFDLTLCLHEDWESNGFYLYELNPRQLPTFADTIIAAVCKVCPVDFSTEIEGWPASGGIIRPQRDPLERPDWAEALYLISSKTPLSYTLEAPSDYSIKTRVDALVEGVLAASAKLAQSP